MSGAFQAIAVGEQTRNEDITFNLENNVIKCEENVKILGVTLDFQLNFIIHVSNHYANIPICFIPQVSPFYIVEKVK